MVSGTANDKGSGGHGIYSVTVNGFQTTAGSAVDNGTANWNITTTLNEGQNTLTVVATDLLMNSTTQRVIVTYTIPDTQRPALNIVFPVAGHTLSNLVVQVSGTANDNVAVASVWLRVNAGDWMQADGTTNWSATVVPPIGISQLQVFAVDTSNNISTTNSMGITYSPSALLVLRMNGSGTVTANYSGMFLQIGSNYTMTAQAGPGFTFGGWTGSITSTTADLGFVMTANMSLMANFLDTINPAIKITNVTTGQRWSNTVLIVRGKASDNWLVTNVLYRLNGMPWSNAVTANMWTNWCATLNLIPGTNSFSAYAVDFGGNASSTNSVSLDFVVTNQVAVRSVGLGTLSPNYSNAWLEIGRNYSMTATAKTGFAFSNWMISTNWIGGGITNNATVRFMMESNLTLQVTFADATTPKLTITAPANGQKMTNALAHVKGTASDNWGVGAVWCQLNGGAWDPAITTNRWTNWSMTLPLLSGTNTVKAYSVDLGGNTSITNTVRVISTHTFNLRLSIASTNALPSNGFGFKLELSGGFNGMIQVSSNLVNWTSLTNFVGTNESLNFHDSAALKFQQRFYRAVTQ